MYGTVTVLLYGKPAIPFPAGDIENGAVQGIVEIVGPLTNNDKIQF